MKHIKIAGACLNQTPLDFKGNTERILAAIAAARKDAVSILCLPELAISGYGCEDSFFSEYVSGRSLQALEKIVAACQGITVSVGLPVVYENCLYNAACMIHDGQVLGFVAKQELAGDGIYYEPRWFKRWPEETMGFFPWAGTDHPIGDLIFEIDGIRIGFEICEDAWTGIRPAQRHYLNNVDLILNPSASNFAIGKTRIRERLVTETSRSYSCTYVYSNLLGNEAGRIIFDGEILIAQGGDLVARNRRLSFDDFQILPAVVDIEAPRIHKKKSFSFEPEEPDNLILADGSIPAVSGNNLSHSVAAYESEEEEFYLAETLGLFDYMRKSRSRGFVLSLSGGADSSACAVLCAKTFERAEAELGRQKFLDRISYTGIDPDKPLTAQLFSCVYQATRNSGEETLESARELALGLGGEFHLWDVSGIHAAYIALAEQTIGRPLSWEQDDITLQNIQARLRAPGIWMIANIRNALLLTTSNRSEAAVGYATMDGDTAGGLAPLAGIDKETLLRWLKWAEKALDVPALRFVNALRPTAELRPADQDQSDESDLMPYGILDQIEECAIRDHKSPADVFLTLRGVAPDAVLKGYIRKFYTLWCRNQWKRERYAPSFHLDDKNLDPKTWCRFPILNGGYWDGLAEMDAIE